MDRYDRQTRLPGFGPDGLGKLRSGRALVVGAGGLGSPVVTYLAGAGVGALRIVDDDAVEASNLHRQVLYTEAEIGQPKAVRAAARARAMNGGVDAEALVERADAGNLPQLLEGVGVAIDCCDNMATRYALNRACLLSGVPYVWAAIGGYCGRCSTVVAGQPCFECVFGPLADQPPQPVRPPVFGPVCGSVGSLAAAEAVKVLTGAGATLAGRLASLDFQTGELAVIAVARDPRCAAHAAAA
ncbi:MAG: HesA/MoeB/ThiF family protein [Propionibacteriaceae bacterium]|jgi:molybdopterin/thiamine biosynthesis adenylyltransferase|nr:HesA/MoeB/ThiF family protein [Propionibacteriaceae bacterium]